ncbi:DUF1254 domain-containing protein [Flammeovirga sp. OC4]|uniref:DUF1254 domain-containing protein n=1 Tax=Flammeovirga sp. OC4 TaxID=1382345 RepID=UPI00069395F7|nr:DUF1254 domain-containing protein [Flammeovirga sp. OC4]
MKSIFKTENQKMNAILAVLCISFLLLLLLNHENNKIPSFSQTTEIPEGILTPNKIKTSIGTLRFMDGVPTKKTVDLTYDNLDRMRGVDVYLKCMQAASMRHLIRGPQALGADEYNRVMLLQLDSKSLYLTANTSTLYVNPIINLKETGPLVMEVPSEMTGAINDAWFYYVSDIGPFGPDKGEGGKYLLLPPAYDQEVPEGYHVIRSSTYRLWMLMRMSLENGVKSAKDHIVNNLKIYPLKAQGNPKPMVFIDGSGQDFNTIYSNDFHFYEAIHEVIQEEPLDMIDAETRGLLASIGIEKGKSFSPDKRLKRILNDAVLIGNATARSIVWYPRTAGTINHMNGVQMYPDAESAWMRLFTDQNVFFTGEDGHTMNSDARTMLHFPYSGISPAMSVKAPGKGSDYGLLMLDHKKRPFNGKRTYKLRIPPNPPVKDFWALTIYDSQTRSMLQTDQPTPTIGSQLENMKMEEDGSYIIYFGPKAPKGYENNWLQTIPNKSWFVMLRMFGPTEKWIDQTWRPAEIELI